MSSEETHAAVRQIFASAQKFIVVSHIRPDGDAVGSLLGLSNSLRAAGKEVQSVLADGVPASFKHLAGAKEVQRQTSGPADITVVLDCSDMGRTGNALGDIVPDLNIDHHITNLNFARVNMVYPEMVATSAILGKYLASWGLSINEAVAKPLLSGLVSDTLGFRTPNVKPEDLRLAADLMEAGATNLSDLYQRALSRRSFEGVRYWGAGLSHIQRNGRMIWTSLSIADRQESGYAGNDDADLINILQNVDESTIAVIFVEQPNGKVKVSWRAQPGFDVSALALSFGGGGHAAAAEIGRAHV
jgi:phosphoesterase RecJ-like protein